VLLQFNFHSIDFSAHTMDIGSFEGLVDFLTLFNTAELFNVLSMESYTRLGISSHNKTSFIEARRLCNKIFAWFSDHYEVLTSEGQAVSPGNLRQRYFSGQVRALLRYKFLEEKDFKEVEQEEAVASAGLKGKYAVEAPTITRVGFVDMKGMIAKTIDGGPEIVEEYDRLLLENPNDHYFESFSWPPSETYELRQKFNGPKGGSPNMADSFRTYDCYKNPAGS
jgi:hypothetical protein